MSIYFAYGSNMDPLHMSKRVPGAQAIGPGRLEGFRLAFNVYSSEWDGGAANLELDERVGERGHVARRLPDPRRHEDGGVEADDVVAALDHGPPPCLFDVALEEDAEGPVVPGGPEPPVDLARREHEPPALGQVDDGVHQIRSGGHTPEC